MRARAAKRQTPPLHPSRILLTVLITAAFIVPVAYPDAALPAANTWYVSTTGDDANPGTEAQPWRSIQHAADTAQAGDTIYVRGGTYGEAVVVGSGGASGSMLTFAAYPGETPVLDGGGSRWAGFQLSSGVSWVRIEGFSIDDYSGVGIDVSGGNSHVELAGLDVSGAETGMRMTWGYSGDQPMFGPVDNVTVTASSFHDNHFAGIDCTPGPCDDLTFSGVTIRDNGVGAQSFGADGLAVEKGARISVDQVRVINNGGDGIDLNSRDGGPVEGIVVSRSTAGLNHRNGIKLWAGGRIENCLVYGTGLDPLPLAAFSGVTVELINNTVVRNMWDAGFAARDYAMTVGYPEGANPPTGISLTMVNNIFAFNTGPAVGSPTGIYLGPGVTLAAENNNLYYSRDDCEIQADFAGSGCFTRADIGDGTWAAATGKGVADLTGDPLFLDPAGADFHPQALSPAINTGTATGAPAFDIDGRQRPRGAGYDIGAYEGSGALQPSLALVLEGSYWASYADYRERRLTATFRLENGGAGGAYNAALSSMAATNGVLLQTTLPLGLSDILSGSSRAFTVEYRVPFGVTAFRTGASLTCEDSEGEVIHYP